MSNYSPAFVFSVSKTILDEKGYVNDPDDPGGETKYGISKRYHPNLDIFALTEEEAESIYYKETWLPLRLDEVKNEKIAGEIFDTAVNMSNRHAVIIAQRSCNFLSPPNSVKIKEDGKIGPSTIAAINYWGTKDPESFFKCLNGFQFMRYVEIVGLKISNHKFSRGWMKRIQSYKEV